jgi:hypothetical protein
MYALTQVYTKDVSTRDREDDGQIHGKQLIPHSIKISYGTMCTGRLQEHVGPTAPCIGFDQSTFHGGSGERSYTPHMLRANQTYWTRLQRHIVFGETNAGPTVRSIDIRNILPLTEIRISDH